MIETKTILNGLRPTVVRLRRLLLPVFLLTATAGIGFSQSPSESPAASRHVLVISVDGMGAQFLRANFSQEKTPNLWRLVQKGSSAQAVIGDYPSVTYPSHTTIVTGKPPAETGIYTNLSSRVAGKNSNDWFWFARAIKVPTLWTEAHDHHLTTGSVAWPVTAGAEIDWDIPEIWNPNAGEVADFNYVAQFSTPGLLQEAMQALGPPKGGSASDAMRAALASFIIEKHKPNLMLVHLGEVDETEHQHGPGSSEAAAALDRDDSDIGLILNAVRAAGVEATTDVFVVSDHGFLPIREQIRPNALLVKAGLLTADAKGNVTGGEIATVSNGGSFFIYWLKGNDLRARVVAALQPLFDGGELWAVLDSSALHDLGADPEARLALDAPTGAEFTASASMPATTLMKSPGGTHGYLPSRAPLESSFIAWGPDIKPGVDLQIIRMTEIGPTVIRVMGIDDPSFGDAPPLAIIK